MALTINLYSFNKRENSTKRPSSPSVTYQGLLKERTGVLHPTITFNIGQASPSAFNYAYIAIFGRYYFITDWVLIDGLWVASMDVDSLATWKSAIGSSDQYVIRSASTWDGKISDGLYPTNCNVTYQYEVGANIFEPGLGGGTYVVGIINSDNSAVGSVSYYTMSPVQFNSFKNYLMDGRLLANIDFTDLAGTSKDLLKTQFNPFQYVVSCMWFPFEMTSGDSIDAINYGWWSVPTSANKLGAFTIQYTGPVMDIPKHPQASRGIYTNISPYSRYFLEFKPFGTIPLDANTIGNLFSIGTHISIDSITGVGILSVVTGGYNDLICVRRAQLGVPVQISQITRDYLGMAGAYVNAVGGAVSSAMNGDVGGVFTSAANGVINTIQSSMPQMSTSGSNGSRVELNFKPIVVGEFYEIISDDIENRGRPLCQRKIISSLSGYTVCADADVSISGTKEENQEIKRYMEGGFFYE